MGTGTIVDERGYILTNYHVVSDVRRIEVTLDDGRGYTAELVAYDAAADLAIIKIPAPKPLPVIRIGTSADLMEGESVIALGNAFGYEQTVTRGIISALGRDVQVSDTQSYDDLIQTDASINPGNSGGPLLNIDGEMIGVNVAVRAGAQGIGFAIPIDQALRTAARLLNVQRLQGKWHGVVTQAGQDLDGPLTVTKVEPASPAETSWASSGRRDRAHRVDCRSHGRSIWSARSSIGPSASRCRWKFDAQRPNARRWSWPWPRQPSCRRRRSVVARAIATPAVWDVLGLQLDRRTAQHVSAPQHALSRRHARGRRAARQPGGQGRHSAGDILVGMHSWETASEQDIQYIVSRPNFAEMGKIKFYVLRGQNTLYGHLNVAPPDRHEARALALGSRAASLAAGISYSTKDWPAMCRCFTLHWEHGTRVHSLASRARADPPAGAARPERRRGDSFRWAVGRTSSSRPTC